MSSPSAMPETVLPSIPAHVFVVELTDPSRLDRAMHGSYAESARVLVKLHGEPLGMEVLPIPPEGISSGDLLEQLLIAYQEPVARRLDHVAAGPETLGALRESLMRSEGTAFSVGHKLYLQQAQRCSVVLCTRNRPADLRRCLESLLLQDHPDFAVWVIDNAPSDDESKTVAAEFSDRLDVRYVRQDRPGLSRARNTALREPLEGDVVAWLDDDEVADPLWLSELTRAFHDRPEVVAASGLVLPAELATQAQVWFEEFGGHSKGRGFVPDEFSPRTWARQHPLFPLPPFGVGANMAFRTEALRDIGGFDNALGAGTLTQGSEDTKAFTDLLRSGGTSIYQPTAMTSHFHRREVSGLERQLIGYGTGLTAFYTATVLQDPASVFTLLRLAPSALGELRSNSGQRGATLGEEFPKELLRGNITGMVRGPILYLRQRWADRTAT